MLNRFKFHQNKRYQPLPRLGHSTVVVGDRLYLWGGWHKSVPKIHSSSEKIKVLSLIEVYNLRTGEWCQIPTSGIPPLGVAYYSCANIGDDLYYFGGRCGHDACHHNTIHRLSTVTMKWKDLTPIANVEDGPMKKAQCGMVGYHWHNEDFLFIFGGYGILPIRHQPQAMYVPKRGKPEYGWTSEVHVFSLQSGCWMIPHVSGEPPPPCSNFSVTSVSDTRAVIFGGFQPEADRLSDVYIVEFGKETVFWNKIVSPVDSTVPWPNGTCDTSMTFVPGLYGIEPCPCVLVVGGENDEGKTLSDCWILDLRSTTWTQIPLPGAVAGRIYHTISSFTIGPHCVWLVLFGGVFEMEDFKDWQDQQMMADTAVVELVKRGNEEWVATVILDNSAPISATSEEYLRKLGDRVYQGRKDWIRVTTKTLSMLPADKERARAERAERRADSAEQEAAEARKLAEVAQQLVLQAKENAVKERKESISLCGDLSDARKRALLAEQQARQAQEECQKARAEAKDFEDRLSEAKKKLEDVREEAREELSQLRDELASVQSSSTSLMYSTIANSSSSSFSLESDFEQDWVISKDEIEFEKDTLLRMKTGDLHVGLFRSTKVIVKTLHKVSTLEDFKRSMKTVSKLRHPNLVLFMGATIGETPLIVTEMAQFKLLNVHLEGAPLSRGHMISIAKDVASALNYLHLQRPCPVVHGSVSSQTVLLEAREKGWKAKLSDTGFFPRLSHPLSTYAAPEMLDPHSHSVKLDVYSFGVLLIELYCRKALGSSSGERNKQIEHINWPEMVVIIRKCLTAEALDRPLIGCVLQDLQQL